MLQCRRALSFSRMLDLGGAPSAKLEKSLVDVSKNCQIQAVCFDFDTLTRSIKDERAAPRDAHDRTIQKEVKHADDQLSEVTSAGILPDLTVVQSIARLFQKDSKSIPNFGTSNHDSTTHRTPIDDDMSLRIGETSDRINKEFDHSNRSKSLPEVSTDISIRYASKLSKKNIIGGLPGIQQAKQHAVEAMTKGDASSHLTARKIVAADSVMDRTKRWMAFTGTGSLLKFVSLRSMKIALLPTPIVSNMIDKEEANRMDDLRSQLQDIKFDIIEKDGSLAVNDIVKKCIDRWQSLQPNNILLVHTCSQ
jgi:hypothetical protein